MNEKIPLDEIRENRIAMEAIVDAYEPEERAISWYYYLEDKMDFPFKAKCILKRKISPLQEGEVVEALAMEVTESKHEMFVLVRWLDREIAVPLVQISPIEIDEDTREVIEDWHYWVARGYEF